MRGGLGGGGEGGGGSRDGPTPAAGELELLQGIGIFFSRVFPWKTRNIPESFTLDFLLKV